MVEPRDGTQRPTVYRKSALNVRSARLRNPPEPDSGRALCKAAGHSAGQSEKLV